MSNLTKKNEIEQALNRAADMLRSSFEPSNFIHYMTFLLFFRYVSDVQNSLNTTTSQKDSLSSFYTLQSIHLPNEFDFWKLYENRKSEGLRKKIDLTISEIERDNSKLTGIFQNIGYQHGLPSIETQSEEILQKLIDSFAENAFNFIQNSCSCQHLISYALELILIKISGNRIEETANIIPPVRLPELLACLVQPEDGESIYDPSCGYGSILLQCIELDNKYKNNFLYGQEKNITYCAIAKLNFILRQFNPDYLVCGDTLREPLIIENDNSLKKFDIVLGKIPFSMSWENERAKEDKFNRFTFGIPPKNRAEYAFILHMLASLKEHTGRMAVIIPHGVLSRSGAEKDIRKNLIDSNLIDAVIGLPPKLFIGTVIPIVILIIRKDRSKDKDILFIDASSEFKSKKIQNLLEVSHIERIINTYEKRENEEKYAQCVELKAIQENDYNLSIPIYISASENENENEIDIKEVRRELNVLKMRMGELKQNLQSILIELT